VLFAYFLGSVANLVPFPGALSGGLIGVLATFGVAPATAVLAVLAYRAVALWLPTPFGLLALRWLRPEPAEEATVVEARFSRPVPAALPARAAA
jgi:hypothetical protein